MIIAQRLTHQLKYSDLECYLFGAFLHLFIFSIDFLFIGKSLCLPTTLHLCAFYLNKTCYKFLHFKCFTVKQVHIFLLYT